MSLLDVINNRISELTAATDAKYKAAGYEIPTASQRKAAELSGQNPYEYATQLKQIETQQKEAEKAAKAAQKQAERAARQSSRRSSGSSSKSSSSSSQQTKAGGTSSMSDLWGSAEEQTAQESTTTSKENKETTRAKSAAETHTVPSLADYDEIRENARQHKKAFKAKKRNEKERKELADEYISDPLTNATKEVIERTSPSHIIKTGGRIYEDEPPVYNPFPQGSMETNLYNIRNMEMADKKAQLDYEAELDNLVEQYREEAAAKGVDLDAELAKMNEYTGENKSIRELALELDKEKHPEKYPVQEVVTPEANITTKNIDEYIDPDRYLEEYEQDAAQAFIDNYANTHENYKAAAKEMQSLQDSMYMGLFTDPIEERHKIMDKYGLSLQQYYEYDKVRSLEKKISNLEAFSRGFSNTGENIFTLANTAADYINDITPDWLKIGESETPSPRKKEREYLLEKSESERRAAETQSPYAYGGGKMADMATRTVAGNVFLNGTGLIDTIANMAGGSEFAKRLVELGLDTLLVDIPTDTIPEMIANFNAGMPIDEIFKRAGINVTENVGMNGVFDVLIPGMVSQSRKYATEMAEKQAAEYAEALGKSTPFDLSDDAVEALLPGLKTGEDVASGIDIDALIKQQEEAAKTIEDLQKQIPAIPEATDGIKATDFGTSETPLSITPDVDSYTKQWDDYMSELDSTKPGTVEITSPNLDNITTKTYADYVEDISKASDDELADILNQAANSLRRQAISEEQFESLMNIANTKYNSVPSVADTLADTTTGATRRGLNIVDTGHENATVGEVVSYYTDTMKETSNSFGTKYADIIENNPSIKESYERLNKSIDDFTNAALHTEDNLDSYYKEIDNSRKQLSNRLKKIDEAAAKDPALGNSNISVLKQADRARYEIKNVIQESNPNEVMDWLPGMEGTTRQEAEEMFANDQATIRSISDTPEIPNNIGTSPEGIGEELPVSSTPIIPETPNAGPARTIAESTGTGPAKASINMPTEAVSIAPPNVGSGKMVQSRVVTHTGVNSKIIDADALKNDPVIQDIAKYERHSNQLSLDAAMTRVENEGQTWLDGIISGSKKIGSDTDVDTTMLLIQDLNKKLAAATDPDDIKALTAQKNNLLSKLREAGTNSGQVSQAFAKWNNTPEGAILNAQNLQSDEMIKPWKAKNKKAVEGNNRIAKALSDMGNKPIKGSGEFVKPTHEQIKKGVIAELDREFGSVEKNFSDSDIEFLTQLAEDKSIPVWQITSEIEHKLNYGDWYTLDESIEMPKPTNRKLENALNSLVNEQVRVEKAAPTLGEVRKEVWNTLEKDSSSFYENFNNDDVDYLSNLILNGASKQDLAEALNTKLATGSWGISEETQKAVNDLFQQASMYKIDSKQFVEAQVAAYKLLGNEIDIKATGFEKFEAWRYLAMLGNPKTMLRNYVGNKTFGFITGFSNTVSALAEAGIDKGIKGTKRLSNRFLGTNFDPSVGIQRTKSVLNPFSSSDRNLIRLSAMDADASNYRHITGSKYEKMDKNALKQSRSVFESKPLQAYENFTDLGVSDYKAVKEKYSTSLAGYLKANGYDTSIFDAEVELDRLKTFGQTRLLTEAEQESVESLSKDVAVLDKAREYALKQADYSTFHEANAVADAISKWSKDARNSDSVALNALGIGLEGTLPFKRTPANILRSGVEYSPLGAIDSIAKTGKLIYENTGKNAGNLADTYLKKTIRGTTKEVNKTLAADVIDSWSKTLTGTGLTVLGIYLYNKGIIHVSDPDLKYQDQLEGKQNYSININGHSYTIDWAAPSTMPLFMGAELAKLWNAKGKTTEDLYNNLDSYLAAANRIADPMVEMSMLQGIQDTINTAADAAQYNENLNIPTLLAYNTLTGYAQQGIPTIAGQIARTVDPTRRSTYTDKEGVAGTLDKQYKKILNKIPGLSMLNQPYVDSYGREQQNSPFDNGLLNLGYQMFSPGYYDRVETTPADEISRQVYGYNKDTGMLASVMPKKLNGERLSPEDYHTAQLAYGQVQYELRSALAESEWFNSLDKDNQQKILEQVNNVAKHAGFAAVDPEYSTTTKDYNAYAEGGAEGFINYHAGDAVLKDSGVSSGTNAYKEAKAAAYSGDFDQAEQILNTYSDTKSTIESYGLSNNATNQKILDQYGEDGLKAKQLLTESDYSFNQKEKELFDEGGLPAIEGYVNDMNGLADAGLDVSYDVYESYHDAADTIPGLTYNQYAAAVKTMDANGNSEIEQKEFLEYINNHDFSEEDVMSMWEAFGEWSRTPYITKKGTWSVH